MPVLGCLICLLDHFTKYRSYDMAEWLGSLALILLSFYCLCYIASLLYRFSKAQSGLRASLPLFVCLAVAICCLTVGTVLFALSIQDSKYRYWFYTWCLWITLVDVSALVSLLESYVINQGSLCMLCESHRLSNARRSDLASICSSP